MRTKISHPRERPLALKDRRGVNDEQVKGLGGLEPIVPGIVTAITFKLKREKPQLPSLKKIKSPERMEAICG
jgi:hypothetical protein